MPFIEISVADLALIMQRRKYRNGCLRRLWWRPDMRWRWCVDLGDGRAWFGMTPREAWSNFSEWARLEHVPYRGPAP